MSRYPRLVAVFILAVSLVASQLPAHAQENPGFLRAVHYLTGAPKVDVFLDGSVVLANLGYQDSSAYVAITAGRHELNFGVAGKNQPGSSPITLEVAAGDLFTFVFSGTLADKAPDVYVTSETGLAQQNNMTLFGDTMPVLFVQGSKDAGSVDVYVNDQLAGNVSNGASLLVNVPLAAYTLKVTATGDATKAIADTAGLGLANVTGVIGLTGTADDYSLDMAYATEANAAQFLDSQTEKAPLEFDILLAAFNIASLDATLNGTGPLTVFAPENHAFDKFDEAILKGLFSEATSAGNVLNFHVLPVTLVYDDMLTLFMNNGTQTTLQGAALTFGLKNQIELGDTPVKLLAWNIHTSNAVIHVIDSVLIPPK